MDKLRAAAQQALDEMLVSGAWPGTIAALRTALAEQPAEPVAWMPIATAPKGRIVLVYYKNSLGNGRTMRARYYLPETLDSDTTESGWADEGWYEESEAYEYLMPLDHEPTHWMPLPAAPDTAPQPKAEQPAKQGPDGLHLVLAGAIFDFAGYMTTRSKVIEVGSTANAAPVADLVKEWANLRGLSLDDAAVLSWQEWLSTAPQPKAEPQADSDKCPHGVWVWDDCEKCSQQPAEQSANPVGAVFQEPVGYLYPTGRHPEFRFFQSKRDGVDGMPVYTAPQPAEQEQEPVATVQHRVPEGVEAHLHQFLPVGTKLFTAPQPTKQPLTDEQFLEMILRTGTQELVGVTTFVGGSIQMHGKMGLLRSAKIIKEFVEAAHGIGEIK